MFLLLMIVAQQPARFDRSELGSEEKRAAMRDGRPARQAELRGREAGMQLFIIDGDLSG
jgi:hypothetical protein